jgi:CHAD domain-containing protein
VSDACEHEPQRPAHDTVAGLVATYLDRQYGAIVRGDADLRHGDDAIHDTRVATRRYRSALRVFGVALDAERVAALDAELKWFAAALGEVRDRQVLRKRLSAAVAVLPAELVLGPVAARLQNMLAAEHAHSRAELDALMRSPRYRALLSELREWQEELPIGTDRPAAEAGRLVRKAERKVRRRRAAVPAADCSETARRDAAMHRVRKAAKRARYAAELAAPAMGKRARRAAKRSKKTQRGLGERQDAVLAARFLHRAGLAAFAAGENAYTYGLLYERERAAARAAER